MKLTVERNELWRGIETVLDVVPAKPAMPILSNLLLHAEGDRLSLAATDLDLSIKTSVAATVEEGGTVTVPARTLAEIARIVGVELNRRIRIIRLPAWPFFIAAALCEGICKPLRIEPPLYRRRVAFFTKDRKFDTSKVFRTLDYAPVHPAEDGIRQTTRWYVNQGWISA